MDDVQFQASGELDVITYLMAYLFATDDSRRAIPL
jgi:hypothetical protein